MQIFRPYVDWRRSASALDSLRLGKQRVEAKQVLNVILRRVGLIKDGLRGWLNHPIVLMYYNDGKPYVDDVVGMFEACVQEWRGRGNQSLINLSDIQPLLVKVEKTSGTPITHIHEIEYRRILLMKNPAHYLKAFRQDEIEEVLETDPVMISGINSWLFNDMKVYKRFVKKVRKML
ncbi:MAG: pyrimidine dimer DNA glycosylase [Candidatus Caldarchaeum sp.]|nr:pyrimidine dimer DNA glycosylase [Candidatus Caldarchaeum sp.]MCS7136812.1 pyrimidine dimer DNA glycosylase [Candidatus Caldarchaeum sp.]MDW7977754.1 pyrimidine dimer DNA glycosylase/endonuclease V [Candidatus Caldarchaeum sp.]MDW8359084.1 pyrimidine dimer DNA glycosylase/endonuclease V [Candidatus Caldarchaeum sp.]